MGRRECPLINCFAFLYLLYRPKFKKHQLISKHRELVWRTWIYRVSTFVCIKKGFLFQHHLPLTFPKQNYEQKRVGGFFFTFLSCSNITLHYLLQTLISSVHWALGNVSLSTHQWPKQKLAISTFCVEWYLHYGFHPIILPEMKLWKCLLPLIKMREVL